MDAFVALLRGINVGGQNIIKMSELTALFEWMGMADVRTYIQSGNVVFRAEREPKLAQRIEKGLATALSNEIKVVLRSRKQMREIVETAPQGFGALPELWRYDVVFLREPLSAAQAFKHVRLREGVDLAYAGKGVLYFQRLIKRATQSYLPKLIGLPVYQEMTIRNWNTTSKLLEMLEELKGRRREAGD